MFRHRAGQDAPPTEYGTAKSNCVLSFFDWRLLGKHSPIKSGFLNRELSWLAGFWFTETPCHAIITYLAHNQHPRQKYLGTGLNSEMGTRVGSHVHRNCCKVGDCKGSSARLASGRTDYRSIAVVIG